MFGYWALFGAVVLAQVGAIADMMMRGETLALPVAGGDALRVRRAATGLGFYAVLTLWFAIFAAIDAIVFNRLF
jgi:hypothetical protein